MTEPTTDETPEKPQWLDDEPEVVAILGAFLDKLDQKPLEERARIPSVSINPDIAPALHAHDEAADRTWALLRSLEGQLFELKLKRNRQPYDPEYLGASTRFLDGSEDICRAWLARPRQKRYQDEWATAVGNQADAFADRGASLLARPVRVPGRGAQEVVAAFTRVGTTASGTLTRRQLSARVFWGHSKVLDAREDLLRQLFPGFESAPRPVLVQVHLPRVFEGVLFIENLDNYLRALAGRPEEVSGLALVYGAGFKGSAERIRRRDGVSLHFHGNAEKAPHDAFEAWWFDAASGDQPAWFWGDLDFSGMAILKALRQRFGGIQAWEPGYAPMIELLLAGEGHAPATADKAEQVDPGYTGCRYADEVLLPAMRRTGRFVDQEII